MKKILKLFIYIIHLPLYWISLCIPKDRRIWIFGAWYGEKYADNPKYLFEYIHENDTQINAIWLSKERDIISELRKKGFSAFYTYSFWGYWYALKAGVAVFCQSKNMDLNKFVISKNTFLVQTWHGIPLKKIGYDDKKFGYNGSQKGRRRFIEMFFPFESEKFGLFVVTSEFTKNIFQKAFKLDDNTMFISGYPRTDYLIKKGKKNKKDGVTKIIYLPTFRGKLHSEFTFLNNEFFKYDEWDDFLGKNNFSLSIKLHPMNYLKPDTITQIDTCLNISLCREQDVYTVLPEYDILITDFSSVFFDFLLLNRPMLFLAQNLNHYLLNDRELYFNYEEFVPGPICNDWTELQTILIEQLYLDEMYQKKREELLDKLYANKDAMSCKRLTEEIKHRTE